MSDVPAYFQGPERIETWALARKRVRMGDLDALGVGDLARAVAAAREGRRDDLLGYVEVMHPGHLMMVEVTYEWCVRVVDELARARGEADALRAAAETVVIWHEMAALPPAEPVPPLLDARLAPGWLAEHRAAYLRRARAATLNLPDAELTAELERLRGAVGPALDVGPEAAAEAVTAYHEHARALHDAMIAWLWAASEAVARLADDDVVEEVLNRAFQATPPVNVLWPALHLFQASDAAFFLAEHLRGHFSGRDRDSTVPLVDEGDRWRLVGEPCGSGGAVRRRLAGTPLAGIGRRKTPKDTAWGRADVPFYCMHCAYNELRSIETLGFPRWVTDYDPDDTRPCAWVVYKRPEDVPEGYFTRLGLRRDPSRFRRSGGLMGTVRAIAGVLAVHWRARR